ncbi:transposon-transfer assisting family protein [Faecalibacterium prausnitzii]|uniref:transposon-transfer assisting family protein n=1 Tax=Faecalibacterium prausnitzii TaxID=853 RepID=UPI001CBAAD19|nr:transposon-transfer assisting family protein [Faecalibacterium prausnitzii]
MSKVHFDENELMIVAMFEQDTAENTKKELEEVLPYVADDMAVRLLVEQMISKMENLPDEQFKNLELDLYRPDAPEEEKV